MLYRLLRPLLFRFDAERAHDLGLASARLLANRPKLAAWVRKHVSKPSLNPVQLAGMTFPNPIGLAAGLDKNAVAPLAWWAFGFGFAELGTVTPRPQAGKPRPRLFRFPQERAIVNRMGFNNDGAEAVARRLELQRKSGLRPPFPIGLSIGKNAVTPPEQAAEDYGLAAAALAPHADYLAINVSSPNTPGLRGLQTAAELTRIFAAIRAVAPGKPLFVKVAPELAGDELAGVLETCVNDQAAGVIATNTVATHGEDGLPEGGLSGRPIHERSLKQVALIRRHLGDRLAVIGCGGIEDEATARAMFEAGADLVQLYTSLIYRGPLLPARLSGAIDTTRRHR
jgi:dihydroorotate dehydrogenase